jgi:hypothetical protein
MKINGISINPHEIWKAFSESVRESEDDFIDFTEEVRKLSFDNF